MGSYIPEYPPDYATSGRSGVVTVSCLITPEGHPTDCHLVSVVGGDEFGTSIMKWLASGNVRYTPARHNGIAVAARTNLQINFEPSDGLVQAQIPTGSSGPEYPPDYAAHGRVGFVRANCLVHPDGTAADCHLVEVTGGDEFGPAALAWFQNPTAHFPHSYRDGVPSASREILVARFVPPPS